MIPFAESTKPPSNQVAKRLCDCIMLVISRIELLFQPVKQAAINLRAEPRRSRLRTCRSLHNIDLWPIECDIFENFRFLQRPAKYFPNSLKTDLRRASMCERLSITHPSHSLGANLFEKFLSSKTFQKSNCYFFSPCFHVWFFFRRTRRWLRTHVEINALKAEQRLSNQVSNQVASMALSGVRPHGQCFDKRTTRSDRRKKKMFSRTKHWRRWSAENRERLSAPLSREFTLKVSGVLEILFYC